MATNDNMMGTSMSTPTTVANDAPELRPKSDMATATASSKKLLAPIIAAGAQTGCDKRSNFPPSQVIKNMK
jgi:hypothetical protein